MRRSPSRDVHGRAATRSTENSTLTAIRSRAHTARPACRWPAFSGTFQRRRGKRTMPARQKRPPKESGNSPDTGVGSNYQNRCGLHCEGAELSRVPFVGWLELEQPLRLEELIMSIGTIILIILVIALLGGFSGIGGGPFYGTGYYRGGGLGLVVGVLLVLLLMGRL